MISKLELEPSNYELVPFDNALEVTSDFKGSADITPSDSESNVSITLHKSESDENCSLNKTVTQQDMELISHYINIDAENDVKLNQDLEVIRTKVVRRTKRSTNQNQPVAVKANNDSGTQGMNESNTSLENRLSKATTDSGLCLETPYSSDSELTDATDEIGTSDDVQQTTFQVGDFCHDISVTFSTPVKSDEKQTLNSAIEERGAPEGQEDPIKNKIPDRLPLLPGDDGLDDKTDSEEELSIYDMCKISPATEKCDKSNEECKSKPVDSASEIKSVDSFSNTKSSTVDVISEELAKLALEKPENLDLRQDILFSLIKIIWFRIVVENSIVQNLIS